MKIPDMPRDGVLVETTIREIINFIRASKITNVIGGKLKSSTSGTTIELLPSAKNIAYQENKHSHPWKVTSNGDDSVTVAPGKLLSVGNESVASSLDTIPTYFHLKEFKNYAGGIIGSIAANGYIYASIPYVIGDVIYITEAGVEELLSQRIVPDTSATLTVGFATSLPITGDVFVYEIARVTYDAGLVTVTDQVLTHNPQLWSFNLQINPP